MKKRDIILSMGIGACMALLLFFIAKNTGVQIPFFWILFFALPLLSAFGMTLAHLIARKIPFVLQTAKFLLIGALNTLIDLGILNLFIYTSGIASGTWFVVFKGVSFTGAVLNSYAWNKFWTFQKKTGATPQKTGKEFLQFLLVSGIGFFINVGTASIAANVIGPQFGLSANLWANASALFATALSLVWNFAGYKLLVFKNS
ncbi:MAG: GtrA family protein [Candidatus Wildermuthbacteria bacterium]|nr:GtrA family protein [Candidatus Wildermuthbacteria bacterium]